MSNGLVVLGGFAIAVGLPAYYVVIKKRASDSLNALLAERFAQRPCPVGEVHTTLGWVQFYDAYNDNRGSGLVLVLVLGELTGCQEFMPTKEHSDFRKTP